MTIDGLAGKSIIVTAGGNGIGLATARALVENGARVAIVDISADAVAAAVAELGSDKAIGITADVGSLPDVDSYFDECIDRFGRVDALFNNAGITAPRVPLADLDLTAAAKLLDVNIMGTVRGMQRMIAHARDHGQGGTILNTSSGTALQGAPNTGFYSATKAAIISLTKTVAIEAAEYGIRVNTILPGPTETPTLLAAPEERKAFFLSTVPLGRFGKPTEVAGLAAWLLSDQSSYCTAGVFAVDGGSSA
ncbi:SDR family NAD(P)-dependent oxidoreductase [Salinibacterium hongtaonis]|uniref:Short-chain dehydrogenase n=1 Tax=Homoserinimonas hongtaonis TaxID=2079791 RepID=A0A2U1T2Q8_9MICO|nr:glucose 1-dehydrogenase [Salinibacterium hongtaonis]PWB98053.1 short-chain dehydrogenase [Salinibacterium hongtaonis]